MHDDVYIPVSDYTDEQKAVMENNVKSEYAELEAYDFAEVTYSMGTNYLSVHMRFKDLDKAENIEVLQSYGIFEEGDFDYISIKNTRENFLALGYIEK